MRINIYIVIPSVQLYMTVKVTNCSMVIVTDKEGLLVKDHFYFQ